MTAVELAMIVAPPNALDDAHGDQVEGSQWSIEVGEPGGEGAGAENGKAEVVHLHSSESLEDGLDTYS
jgi:hypothetical protein